MWDDDALDGVVESWTRDTPRLSRHLELSIFASRRAPLAPGAPVPGCNCEGCTGLADDHPARSAYRKRWRRGSPLDVEGARGVSILDVAERLGLGTPRRKGREYVCHCPLHDDSDPSLTLNPHKGLWYCFPCAEGGDGIKLVMRTRGCTFVQAVRELTQ